MKMNWMLAQGAKSLMLACCLAVLNSCGSGAVSSSSDPTLALTLSPATTTAYPGVPVTFFIAGGGARSPYQLTSTNASLLEVPTAPISDSQISLVPGSVSSQQNVTISVRDQAGNTASSAVSVQPNLINGDITITGTAPPEFPACAGTGFICSGQSGTASLTVSAGGSTASRSVRFDVIQGAFKFPTDVAQTVFATSITVKSDESGKAAVVIRADVGASPQIATIRVTDVLTGAFRTTTFFIKQPSIGSGQFVTVPPEWKVAGTFTSECPGGDVDYLIFGGTPPYSIRTSSVFLGSVSPSLTPNENPSRFTAHFSAAACNTTGYQVVFTVTDATGLSIQALLTITPGAGTRPAPSPSLTVSPSSLTLQCGQSAQVLATVMNAGTGTSTITASVATPVNPSDALVASVTGNVITITRGFGTPPAGGKTVGVSPATVNVGAGSAPPQTISITTPLSCP